MADLTPIQIRKRAGELCEQSYSAVPDFDADGIQVVFTVDEEYLYIIFVGSNEKKDWLTNFRFWAKEHNGNHFHGGYFKTLAPHVRALIDIAESRNVDGLPIIIGGHSAGGGWAVDMAVLSGLAPDQIVTFGAPRALKRVNESTQRFLNVRLTNYKNAYDFVTKLPLFWRDFGKQVVAWFRIKGDFEHEMRLYNEVFFKDV